MQNSFIYLGPTMHRTELVSLFTASIAVSAPSIESSQINFRVIDMGAQIHGSVVHSSQELE